MVLSGPYWVVRVGKVRGSGVFSGGSVIVVKLDRGDFASKITVYD